MRRGNQPHCAGCGHVAPRLKPARRGGDSLRIGKDCWFDRFSTSSIGLPALTRTKDLVERRRRDRGFDLDNERRGKKAIDEGLSL